jgi:ribokinase
MSPAPRLFVLASYMRDVSIAVDRFPVPGETRTGDDGLEAPGGKGSNQAIQAARCGASVAIAGAVGDDAAGRAALALWAAEGIDTAGVVIRPGHATGLAVILVDRAGENQIVIAPGANRQLLPADIIPMHRAIADARLVLAQLETPIASTLAAFAQARAGGVPTLLNAAPVMADLPETLCALTDILVVNEVEAAALADRAPDSDPHAAGERLLARFERVVITLGERGALLFQRGETTLHCPAPAVTVIDSTGAGDAFVGAFATHWAATGDAGAALARGVSAGSLACTTRGAVPARG